MDCPNCNERPVGLFHSFRPRGIGIKRWFQGYFKCKHCGTILRQKKSSVIFPKFKKSFWPFYLFFIGLIIVLGLGGFAIMTKYDFQPPVTISLLVIFGIVILGIGDEIRSRFWIIEQADPEEDAKTAEKLSTTGLVLFTLHAIISGGLVIWILESIEINQLNETLLFAGIFLFFLAVIGGAIVILKKFSIQPEESFSEDVY